MLHARTVNSKFSKITYLLIYSFYILIPSAYIMKDKILMFTLFPIFVFSLKHTEIERIENEVVPEYERSDYDDQLKAENHAHADEVTDNNDVRAEEDPKWWDSESQNLLDSQQLVEGLSLCADLLQSQSPNRNGNGNDGAGMGRPSLSDYAQLGAEHLKKDLEECQNLVLDPPNIELDTPPEFRLSQLVCCFLCHFVCFILK